MLNYIWLGLILCAVVMGGFTHHLKDVTDQAVKMTETAVMGLALPLVGIMALWLGIMRLAERSGMVQILARVMRPIMVRLFPDVPVEHPAMGSMLMNIAANMLGLNNASTPLGLRAMRDLESLNPRPGTATNAMCTFLAINTSSVQLIPVTAVGVLAVKGSSDPSSIIGTSFLATTCSTIVGIAAVKFLQNLRMYRLAPVSGATTTHSAATAKMEEPVMESVEIRPMRTWSWIVLLAYFACIAFAFFYEGFPEMFGMKPGPDLQTDTLVVAGHFQFTHCLIRAVKTLSLIAIPLLISFFPLYAMLRGIKVYEEFVEGAKEGFQVAIRIIPYLLAILVAIGMFRGAGCLDLLTDWLRPVMALLHFPPELLPMALIRPLSGSGTLGVFTELVNQYGGDHILSKMAGTIFGSTETTFYVLAVYFGSVNIKKTRHAVPAGLLADAVGIFASVYICRLVFA